MLSKTKSKTIRILCALLFLALGMTFALSAGGLKTETARGAETEYGVDLAYGRRVSSTEAESGDVLNTYAVDANPDTRYASRGEDDAYFYVDLGNTEKINKIVIDWEAAYASEYKLQLSMDAITWTDVAVVQKDAQSKDVITFPYYLTTRFVRFQGVSRATDYGYSFYSFEVYGPKNLATGEGVEVLEVSSYEAADVHKKENIVDNVANTRWASAQEDNQYVIIDLGEDKTFDTVKWKAGRFPKRPPRVTSKSSSFSAKRWRKSKRPEDCRGSPRSRSIPSNFTIGQALKACRSEA